MGLDVMMDDACVDVQVDDVMIGDDGCWPAKLLHKQTSIESDKQALNPTRHKNKNKNTVPPGSRSAAAPGGCCCCGSGRCARCQAALRWWWAQTACWPLCPQAVAARGVRGPAGDYGGCAAGRLRMPVRLGSCCGAAHAGAICAQPLGGVAAAAGAAAGGAAAAG